MRRDRLVRDAARSADRVRQLATDDVTVLLAIMLITLLVELVLGYLLFSWLQSVGIATVQT